MGRTGGVPARKGGNGASVERTLTLLLAGGWCDGDGH